MKHTTLTLIILATLSLGLTSCSDNKEEAAPAPAAKTLNTPEDYAAEMFAMQAAVADFLSTVTAENSASKVAELKTLIQKVTDLQKEIEDKKIVLSEELISKYADQSEALEAKTVEHITRLIQLGNKLAPEFLEAMQF